MLLVTVSVQGLLTQTRSRPSALTVLCSALTCFSLAGINMLRASMGTSVAARCVGLPQNVPFQRRCCPTARHLPWPALKFLSMWQQPCEPCSAQMLARNNHWLLLAWTRWVCCPLLPPKPNK